jgi:hypothetical protein
MPLATLGFDVDVGVRRMTDADAEAAPLWNWLDEAVTGTTTCWALPLHL